MLVTDTWGVRQCVHGEVTTARWWRPLSGLNMTSALVRDFVRGVTMGAEGDAGVGRQRHTEV